MAEEATTSSPRSRGPPEFSEFVRGHEAATMSTEDAATLGLPTADASSLMVYNQDWGLSFTRDRLEKHFWRRLQKRIRLSSVAFYCVFALIFVFLLATLWEENAEKGEQRRNTQTTIFVVIIFIMALVELVMWARQNEEDRIDRYLKTSSALLMILAACVTVLNQQNRIDRRISNQVENDACRNSFVVEPSSDQWVTLFCGRSLFSTHIDFMAFAALRRISFKSCVLLAIFNVLCAAIFIIVVPYKSEPVLGAYQVIHTITYTCFICFVRYLVERAERQHFIAVHTLEQSVQELRSRREQLLAAVEALLPRQFIERSSATFSSKSRALKAEDVAENAAVLLIGIHDFTVFSSSLMPMDVVRAVDDFVSIAMQHLDLHGLDKIWVHQDEIMAVGNLLQNSAHSAGSKSAAFAALIAWQLAVGESIVSGGTGGKRIPIHAAVDVGAVRGKFTGSRRIRYDVFGDAVEQARAVLLYAEANQALITTRGLDSIPGAVAADADQVITAAGSTGEIRCTVIKAVTIDESMRVDKPNPEDSCESGLGNRSSIGSGNAGSPTTGAEEGLLIRTVAFANEKSFAAVDTESSSSVPLVRSGEKLMPTWCFFAEYEDPGVEEAYRQERMKALPQRGSNALFGLASCHGVYLILTAIDIGDPQQDQAGGAVVLIVIAILTEILVAMYARCASTSSLAAHHTAWSAAAVLSPLLALYGFALSRPALVGLDISYLVLMAAMARSPCFVRAKHQLVAIPLLLIAGQISMVLPGGSLTFQNVIVWVLSMFLILVDRDLDTAHRSAFEANRVVSLVHKSLLEEQEIRSGLLENAVPRKVLGALEELNVGERIIMRRPDSVQMVVSQKPNAMLGESEVAFATLVLFTAIDSTEFIDVCDIFGDSVVVAGPILRSLRGKNPPEDAALIEAWHVLQALFLTADTTASSVFDALVDLDSTIQLLRNQFPPTFTVQGAALRVLQSVRSLVDRGAQSGFLVTNRLVNVLRAHSQVDSSEYEEHPKDPWRVRGLGILRFIELRRNSAAKQQVLN